MPKIIDLEQEKAKKHLKILTDEELELKRQKLKNENTKKQNRRADSTFQKFLEEAGCESTEYWLYDEPTLDKYLAKFWFGVRKLDTGNEEEEGEKYSSNSLQSFRYGLNQILKEKGHLYDITKDSSFTKSIAAYNNAVKELKAEGKAVINSALEIVEDISLIFYNVYS